MRIFYKVLTAFLLVAWDVIAVAVAIVIGLGLKFGFFNNQLTIKYYVFRWEFFLLASLVMLLCNVVCRCYSNVWKHAGMTEYLRQIIAVLLSTVIITVLDYIYKFIPQTELIVIIACLELILVLGVRASIRFFYWLQSRARSIKVRKRMTRVAIFGAGEEGANLVHKLMSHPEDNRLPVCFIDDNENMWGKKVNGLPVAGGRQKLGQAIDDYHISEVIMAVSSVDHETVKELLTDCHRLGCSLKRFGTIDDVDEKNFSDTMISDLNLEDLLRRDSVQLNMMVVKGFVENKTVLVTGGAGSIGSEICRQVLSFGAKKLLIFDICENGLYEINNELREKYEPERFETLLGSIRDIGRLHEIFVKYSPQVVFHAAAHKHVPMMELNPLEAIKNNVFGTINLAHESIEGKAEKFILISTDKAVNPANIMGASKRIAEIAIQIFGKTSSTDFAAVRFGNVLGSSGSVVPFFKKQIKNGGPVTVTHPEMRRYFMTIPEAVQLVLEAGAMANGGEIFVLDMGEPVLIYDLACDLIRLSGFEPEKDIKIEFTGLRPGEKLFEEISLADEDVTKTNNNMIFTCKPIFCDDNMVRSELEQMHKLIKRSDMQAVFDCVRQLVPTFRN
jgi:FlaA1/EpsC-like NDP-sugar epimerase